MPRFPSSPAACSIATVALALVITASCGGTVTNVGSVLGDGGTEPTIPDGGDGSSPESNDASAPDGDAGLDAHSDSGPCAAGVCGTNVCGRDECGHSCGTCPGSPPQGGCFVG